MTFMIHSKGSLSVIVPALNEEKTILTVINNIQKSFPDSEIIVVDNGSSDSTRELVAKTNVKLIYEPRKGKGHAMRTGFLSISEESDAIFMVDGDDTYGLEALNEAFHAITHENVDLIVGTRLIQEDSPNDRKKTFIFSHKVGNFFLSKLSQLLHPSGISDSLSGWRMMSPAFVWTFPNVSQGFEIEAELNAHAHLLGASVRNVNVKYSGRPIGSESKLNTYRDGLRIFRLKFKFFGNDRPQLAYSLISIPWMLASILLVSRSLKTYLNSGQVPQFPSLIAGVGAFLVGLLLLIAGIILERIKLLRVTILRNRFSEIKRRRKD